MFLNYFSHKPCLTNKSSLPKKKHCFTNSRIVVYLTLNLFRFHSILSLILFKNYIFIFFPKFIPIILVFLLYK